MSIFQEYSLIEGELLTKTPSTPSKQTKCIATLFSTFFRPLMILRTRNSLFSVIVRREFKEECYFSKHFFFSQYYATKTLLLFRTVLVQIRISFSHYQLFCTRPQFRRLQGLLKGFCFLDPKKCE